MDDRDKPEFLAALKGCAEYYDRALTPGAYAIYWAGLADLPLEAVKAGLNVHVRDPKAGQYMPKVADVRRGVATITADQDGHPGPDEAWAIAAPARSDGATVVWTEQISNAFHLAAAPLLEAGDKVAARKSFLERYELELSMARRFGVLAHWYPSLGFDSDHRERVIQTAIQQGRLAPEHGARLLPQPAGIPESAVLALEAGLFSRETAPGEARSNVVALRKLLGRSA